MCAYGKFRNIQSAILNYRHSSSVSVIVFLDSDHGFCRAKTLPNNRVRIKVDWETNQYIPGLTSTTFARIAFRKIYSRRAKLKGKLVQSNIYHLKNMKATMEMVQKNKDIPHPTMAVASKPNSLVVASSIVIS